MYWISTHPEFKNSTGDPIQGQPDIIHGPPLMEAFGASLLEGLAPQATLLHL